MKSKQQREVTERLFLYEPHFLQDLCENLTVVGGMLAKLAKLSTYLDERTSKIKLFNFYENLTT